MGMCSLLVFSCRDGRIECTQDQSDALLRVVSVERFGSEGLGEFLVVGPAETLRREGDHDRICDLLAGHT